jgi:hypothetical protein
MQTPNVNESLSTILYLSRYAIARVQVDPAVAAQAELLTGPDATLRKSVAARNAVKDQQVNAQALRDFTVDQFKDLIADLARRAYAHFGTREADGYKAIFPTPASDLATTSHSDRPKVYGEFMARVGKLAMPAELAKLVKPLAEAWMKVQAADAQGVEVAAELRKVQTAERAAREAWVAGYVQLQSQIRSKFPTDRKRVERYFRSVARAKAAVKPESGDEQGGEK